jgi:hypothetical protein
MADIDRLVERAASAVISGGDPRPGLQPLVEVLLQDPDAYPASNHILGFIHCRVAEVNGQTLRIHIWPKRNRSGGTPDWPVHTHHWTISSAILAGYVFNETFEVTQDEEGRHQNYEVQYLDNGKSERIRTNMRVSSALICVDRWSAGERYEIPLNTYHSTSVPDGVFAATAILTGVSTTLRPLVLGDASGGEAYQYTVDRARPDDWLDALSQLLKAMEVP